ncbi:hypothetical protein [Stenotrophomonas maltophilia]|uniref:hypothetical protein n=1 Tax=Stenotrophomonas maltophilia TaxID=40324 RepID=UPI0007F9102B|nr:hypothetical protein [Stenotrophomonas maltophilia]OBU59222.1 hypothetical protein A9K70_01480 [Stenotrophomonas maltophilia]
MSTDKTLADVKPGGRVRLGDQALRVFSAGRWTYDGTGQSFSHEEMDAAAFVVYRDAALSAQPSPGAAVPAGWKLVPIEPTWSMRNDGREFLIDGIEKEPERLAHFLWKTMINAAPEVP